MSIWETTQRALARFAASDQREAQAERLLRLAEVIGHHRLYSRGYEDLVAKKGIPQDWSPHRPEDLSQLPLIDKGFLRDQEFNISPSTTDPVTIVSTSGTTSVAAEIPHNESSIRTGLGENFARALVLGGIAEDRWCLVGHWDESSKDANVRVTGSFLSMAWLARELETAPLFRNGASGMDSLVGEMRGFRPTAVASSPHLLAEIARQVLDEGESIELRGLLYGGARATDAQRELWDRAFAPNRIVAFYPTTDAGALGVSVNDDGRYLTFSETHFVEVVNPGGEQVDVGDRGRIAVTAYNSLAAPIIRYLVGDEVTYEGLENSRVVVSDIQRTSEAAIGDTLLPVSVIEEWATRLNREGHRLETIQLVVQRDEHGRDRPVLRLHNVANPGPGAKAAAIGAYLSVAQLAYEVSHGTVAEPEVEVVAGSYNERFKVPLYVDERR